MTMPRNFVSERISEGKVAVSMVVRLVQSVEIAGLAKASGFDSLYVDLEHCAFSIETTSQICMTALVAGVTPFVRVPSFGPEYVSRVLDAGAMGVIAPHVSSAADAREVVANAKFAPIGCRSVTAGIPHFGFAGVDNGAARKHLNETTTVVVMIETIEGLQNVDEIAAVEGVDILLVGTNDLCSELGIEGQYDHHHVKSAYARVIEACKRHGKAAGIGGLASRPDLTEQFVQAGARYVSAGSDLSFLLAGARNKASTIQDYAR